jgi:hypothetical protein
MSSGGFSVLTTAGSLIVCILTLQRMKVMQRSVFNASYVMEGNVRMHWRHLGHFMERT